MQRSRQTLLVFFLLTGLLFSSGEGITLLPFPQTEDEAAILDAGQPPLTKSLGVVSNQSPVKLKTLDRYQEFGTAGSDIFLDLPTKRSAFKRDRKNISALPIPTLAGFPGSRKGRAPPFFQIVAGIAPDVWPLRTGFRSRLLRI